MDVGPHLRRRLAARRAGHGITERTAHGILSDLVDDGYLRRKKEGRRNRYECVEDLPLRHPIESDHQVGELLRALRG